MVKNREGAVEVDTHSDGVAARAVRELPEGCADDPAALLAIFRM
jgi:hypothetical protein